MQGIAGPEIPPSAYNYIVEKTNLKNVPRIEYSTLETNFEIKNEHDVEIKLLELLLEKLHWRKEDYVTQMVMRMGRNEKMIRDYIILPETTPYHETAYFVWDAKKSIPNTKQLQKDKGQVISYARRLNAQKCGLISQEGVWIMEEKDDYGKIAFHGSWKELEDADVFNKLLAIAGR